MANLHPMRSATGAWMRAEDGSKLHVILDRYFEESQRRWKMMGSDFTNFHRTLSTYVRGFLNAGFTISDIGEPTITPEQLESYPELRVPNFIIYTLGKP